MTLAELHTIKKYFGDVHAVDGVSFQINEGERISIIGPNGAGKTTLINVITGLVKPDSGRIVFEGRDITGLPPSKRCKLGLARSFQLPTVFPKLTAFDSIRVSVISRLGKSKNFYSPLEYDEEVNKIAKEVLELFELYDKKDLPAVSLPQGDKKLLDVASAFALRPKLILLDEPTSGVSTMEKRKIMDTLISASKEVGVKSILQVEHDMDVVFSYSSRIIVMHEGKILTDGLPEQVRANEEVVRVLLGRG
jgi:branched-chain amino acid transport system ATP-binding protein